MNPQSLLDTNIVSYRFNDHTLAAAYKPLISGHDLYVSFQTVGELLQGAVVAGWGAARLDKLDRHLGTMGVLDSDRNVCDFWALVRAVRRNRPVSAQDAWIAATALSYGMQLVTHNPADFAEIPGLTVITAA